MAVIMRSKIHPCFKRGINLFFAIFPGGLLMRGYHLNVSVDSVNKVAAFFAKLLWAVGFDVFGEAVVVRFVPILFVVGMVSFFEGSSHNLNSIDYY